MVLVLTILVLAASVADFACLAYRKSNCFVDSPDIDGMKLAPLLIQSGECSEVLLMADEHLSRDAGAALLAVLLLLGATVMLSSAHRRTKRLLLGAEVTVVALAFAYGLLWTFAFR